MKRVALYLRCGTDVEYGMTEKLLETIIAEHGDWQLANKFVDNGYSSNDMKRPALNEMIAASESGEIDLVLIHGIKHLTRNSTYFIELVERLKRAGVGIYDTSNGGLINVDDYLEHPLVKYVRIGGRERKEDTPRRKTKRKYEENHKDERKQKNAVWGTSINREYADEIDAFLKQHRLTKVELIVEGYKALQNQHGPKKTE